MPRRPCRLLAWFILLSPILTMSAEKTPLRVLVTDFGAANDGRTFSTAQVQGAIDHVAATGGGTVVFPEGVYTTGALFVKPGVNLYFEKNSVLRGSTRIDDYPPRPTRIEGHTQVWRPALINLAQADGVTLSGEGVIEGSGQPFWQEFWRRLAADKRTKNLDVDRPRLLFLSDCRNVVISGLTLKDSGFWNLHLYRCQNVLVENLTITAPLGAPSTDGIDVDSCQHVDIRGCTIGVDDDCIALKGSKGPDAMADTESPPVEHIRIEDCTFLQGHGALVLGSEASRVRDVVLERCRVINASRVRANTVLVLKLRPDTPQHYEDIHVRNVTLEGFGRILSIAPWTQYFDLKGKPAPESRVRNVSLSGVTGNFASLGIIKAHDKATIQDVTLENVDVTLADPGLESTRNPALRLKNVRINGAPVPDTP